jgi:subtilase family serine protease
MKYTLVIIMLVGSLIIQAQKKLPDLVVYKISKPEYIESGAIRGTVVVATIKNIGKTASTPVKAKLYDLDISLAEAKKLGVKKNLYWIFEENTSNAKNGIGDAKNITDYDYDPYVENIKQIPPLNPGQSLEITFIIKDYWIYDSNCEIEVFVDFDNQLKEKKENNNKKQFFEGG